MGRWSRGILLLSFAVLLLGAQDSCEGRGPERVYALTADSGLAQGCFPPLLCPVALAEDLGGTFRLRLLSAGDLFDLYEVRDVFWLVRLYGEDLPITGSGSYLDGLVEDQLVLNLRVGDEPTQVFDSGRVPSGPTGSSEIAITVSIHGQSHFDTVIDVRAIAFPDRREPTTCGATGLTCDPDTEICLARTPIGPATVYSCEPIPSGCGDDRSCACAGPMLCDDAFHLCTELGDNQLQCECPRCQ